VREKKGKGAGLINTQIVNPEGIAWRDHERKRGKTGGKRKEDRVQTERAGDLRGRAKTGGNFTSDHRREKWGLLE